MIARLRFAQQQGLELRTTGPVVAQVWRDPRGRQVNLARVLSAVDVKPVDERLGRDAGVLLGRSDTEDAIDATVVAISEAGDRLLTSDPRDLRRLVDASGRGIQIVTV